MTVDRYEGVFRSCSFGSLSRGGGVAPMGRQGCRF